MSFQDYRNSSSTKLESVFHIRIFSEGELFAHFQRSDKQYPELQARVDAMESRISISTDAGNEATRGSLLVSHILWEAVFCYELGIFFEPPFDLSPEECQDLPYQLAGKFDCGINLNKIDFVEPIIAVVEVKPTQIAAGLGQCLAEMHAVMKKFQQSKVYGIITDGEVWKFLLLENAVLTIDRKGYHLSDVAEIVERIGYIAGQFRTPALP